jgi:hypothetical protein
MRVVVRGYMDEETRAARLDDTGEGVKQTVFTILEADANVGINHAPMPRCGEKAQGRKGLSALSVWSLGGCLLVGARQEESAFDQGTRDSRAGDVVAAEW